MHRFFPAIMLLFQTVLCFFIFCTFSNKNTEENIHSLSVCYFVVVSCHWFVEEQIEDHVEIRFVLDILPMTFS